MWQFYGEKSMRVHTHTHTHPYRFSPKNEYNIRIWLFKCPIILLDCVVIVGATSSCVWRMQPQLLYFTAVSGMACAMRIKVSESSVRVAIEKATKI